MPAGNASGSLIRRGAAELLRRYQYVHSIPGFWSSVGWSILLLAASGVINFFAGVYATERASNAVTDIVLSNFQAINVDFFFVTGSLVLMAFIGLVGLLHPKRIPFTLKTLALLIVIRSIFISLTHIGPFPDQIPLDLGTVTSKFIFGGDLFFSNHTAIPFMMALICWRDGMLRWIFLVWSIFFGTIALLGHLHYSIDVMSAFFITYSVYCIARALLRRDYEIINGDWAEAL